MLRSLIQNVVTEAQCLQIQLRRGEKVIARVDGNSFNLPVDVETALHAHLPGKSISLFRLPLESQDLPSSFRGGHGWYVHARANDGPAGPATVAIGGDCIRPDPRDLEDVIRRAGQLSTAMVSKAASALPDLPSLHGGKKGEFIFFDSHGAKIEIVGPEREAVAARLCAALLNWALPWLNELHASRLVGAMTIVPPETGSPDVFTGPWWSTITKETRRLDLDELLLTCPPGDSGGLAESALPTAHGVLAALREIITHIDKPPHEIRILHEGAGGVACHFLPLLLELGIRGENVLVLDRSALALQTNAKSLPHRVGTGSTVYRELTEDDHFDILVVNGDGDQLDHAAAEGLHRAGVRYVVGAANNILKVSEEDSVAEWLAARGIEVIPDPIVSPGGWTYAVILQLLRATRRTPTAEHLVRINAFVQRTVGKAVAEALAGPGAWQRGRDLIQRLTARSDATHLVGEELNRALDPLHLLTASAIL